MSYNGSGTFNINTTGQPVVNGTTISSTVFNALTADLANGLSTALTKDGQSVVSANISLNNFKLTNVGTATLGTDAVNLTQVQAAGSTSLVVTGTDTLVGTLTPALTAYAAGGLYKFIAVATNTGPMTLNINSLGAKAVTREGTTALVAGDVTINKEMVVVYDGTQFQLINGNSFTNLRGTGNTTFVTGGSGVTLAASGFAGSAAIQATGTIPVIQSLAAAGAGNYAAMNLTATGVRDYQLLCRINDGNLTFRDVSASADRMTLNSVGNWAITAPSTASTALTITANAGGSAQQNTVSTGQRVLYGTDGTRAFSIVPTTNGINLSTETLHNMVLQTNAADRVTINNAGSITVAAPTAGNAISVSGFSGSSTYASINTTSGSGSEYHYQATNGTDSSFNILLSQVGAASKYAHLFTASSTPLYLGTSATIRVTVTPSGNTTFSGAASTNPVVVTFNATTMTLNAVLSNVFTTTFTAPVTVAPTISNPQDGQTINWFITQDGTGSRTMTWPTSFKWPGGAAGVLSTAANAVDLMVATYRSTTGFWYATLAKGFA